ncbi:hypothetical protein RHMOL_Rhmol07G0246000 [Rhododendron molle]|uniref:Uncharacterized protein n=1 Tax=Rhododendron molle TaxID=49168 RepID=A0ACC0N692_RHOML|nr:hypothetical protein RHMOL_Rhmol07G0246000 [Rhododendron molle]
MALLLRLGIGNGPGRGILFFQEIMESTPADLKHVCLMRIVLNGFCIKDVSKTSFDKMGIKDDLRVIYKATRSPPPSSSRPSTPSP